MLKTNSKTAINNIRNYIIENYNPDGYAEDSKQANAKTFKQIAEVILEDVKRVNRNEFKRCKNYTWSQAFAEWASGLPGLLDTCYYYNRSAVADLGDLLEETVEERNRYTEREAEKMLSHLIFRELNKAAGHVLYYEV